jgi:hypothetical protein
VVSEQGIVFRKQRIARRCTLCVRDNQHNATKETCGTTFSQLCGRKINERASCMIRGNGGSAEEGT